MKKRVLHLLGVFRPARHPEQHKADDEQHRSKYIPKNFFFSFSYGVLTVEGDKLSPANFTLE